MSRSVSTLKSLVGAHELARDEDVFFLPGVLYQKSETEWRLPLRAWVYEPETRSVWRRGFIHLFGKALGVSDQVAVALLRERAAGFLVDHEWGKVVRIRLGGRDHVIGPTDAAGQIRTELVLTPGDVAALEPADEKGWHSFSVRLRDGDDRRFIGTFQRLEPTGVSVISDVDDTIKLTNVGRKRLVLLHTFTREFAEIPGMDALYQRWAAQGAAFHYLSSSPWPLGPALRRFLKDGGFPAGSLHLRRFRLDLGTLAQINNPVRYKIEAITHVIETLPKRTFWLVGDDSEKDPEIYATLYQRFPRQVERIFIRDTGQSSADRFERAFRDVPAERCQVFKNPADVLAPR
jgi:hypothetical protein